MELKEFAFDDPDWPQWPDKYAVLFVDGEHGPEDTHYVLNAAEPGSHLRVRPEEIDHYIQMLIWCRAHAEQVERDHETERAVKAGIAEPVVDPRTFVDSQGVTEEDG